MHEESGRKADVKHIDVRKWVERLGLNDVPVHESNVRRLLYFRVRRWRLEVVFEVVHGKKPPYVFHLNTDRVANRWIYGDVHIGLTKAGADVDEDARRV